MIIENENLIDFEVYKYFFPNFLHLTILMIVLLTTVVFYIIYLPFMWLVPAQKMLIAILKLLDIQEAE